MDPDVKGTRTAQRKLSTIRNRILKKIEEHKEHLGDPDDPDSVYSKISRGVHFADVTYRLMGKEVAMCELNLLASLVHGPLYCSEEFPRPKDRKGVALFPVLQIETTLINNWCNRKFAPGLVQVWAPGLVRFIPESKVSFERLINDDAVALDYNSWPGMMISSWTAEEGSAVQINGSIPVGYSYPEILPYLSEDELPADLVADLRAIEWRIFEPEIETLQGLHLFGDFHPHQLSPLDFYPSRLLLRHAWGDVSSGLVFFSDPRGGEWNFTYHDCGR